MILPDWIPKDPWDGWVEMRGKIRAPLTDRAKHLAIRMLNELREQGHDPGEVLDQSTLRCWRGLFPIVGKESRRDYDFIQHGSAWKIVHGVRVFVRNVQ
jgi:hypothetical protein